ncbi:hypothetical protein CCMSSC00406_0009625 [Pleurotus cornucopiae]|uniref:Uncharacterized protein n=1 Tax=Pleurotus cornucopiae TaxID=5321 RepID=A0ACB7INU3_PLECO|nr:hypothetical protein CCMSSC00406_0009625 [Pleurotus cornucopiae]
MADNDTLIASEFMVKDPPETLNPTTIPPLWGSMAPGGYRTPPYTLGWRLTPPQLRACLDPERARTTIPIDYETRCITPRWREFGYGKNLCGSMPRVATMPARDGVREYDLIVYFSSNASKEKLEAVRGPKLEEMIAAAIHTLNLPDDLAPDLKWHAHLRRSKTKQN